VPEKVISALTSSSPDGSLNKHFFGLFNRITIFWELTIMKTMFAVVALAISLISAAPAFAFQPGMTLPSIDSEVKQRLANGESLKTIVTAAHTAGISPAVLTSALILSGANPAAVVTAMVEAGMSANAVVAAAVASGSDSKAMVAAAIAGGADPTTLTASTAAGGNRAGGDGGSPGFSGSGFSASRASTFGGGGRSSVSPS
jgi:hypothetical protein